MHSLDLHTLDDHVDVKPFALVTQSGRANLGDNGYTVGDGAEHAVSARSVRGQGHVAKDQEELGAHGLPVPADPGHRDGAGRVYVIGRGVLDWTETVARPSAAGSRRVTALQQGVG